MVLNKQEKERLPSTLKRSPAKAQDTYMHTLESAEKVHGDGEAAHRIAFGSLKHSFEKVGDHWEPKDERGPSDDQDAKRGEEAIDSDPYRRWGQCECHEGPSARRGQTPRSVGTIADDQGRARRRNRQGQSCGHLEGSASLTNPYHRLDLAHLCTSPGRADHPALQIS